MKKALFWIVAVAAVIFFYRFPKMVESSIPSAYYVTPSQRTHENMLSCSGTLQAAIIHEVYLQSAAIPKTVPVMVGDSVEEGELLLQLDPADQLGGEALGMIRSYSQGGNALLGAPDLASVAALYGLSSALGGGLTDYTDLAGLLMLVQEERVSQVEAALLSPGQVSVYSPASGIITGVTVRESVPALPGISLITISDTSSGYKVLASVPEADISRVQLGNRASIRCAANPLQQYEGRVTKIYPTAHKALKGTVTETVVDVEITLDQWDESLKPGFTARVDIFGGEDSVLITVPYEAIRQDENNDEYVYVYQDGSIQKNLIVTGQELTNEVEVLFGLSQDSIVIFNPGDVVREGAIVNLKGRAHGN